MIHGQTAVKRLAYTLGMAVNPTHVASQKNTLKFLKNCVRERGLRMWRAGMPLAVSQLGMSLSTSIVIMTGEENSKFLAGLLHRRLGHCPRRIESRNQQDPDALHGARHTDAAECGGAGLERQNHAPGQPDGLPFPTANFRRTSTVTPLFIWPLSAYFLQNSPHDSFRDRLWHVV